MEAIATLPIAKYMAEGLSVGHTASRLDMDVAYIKQVCRDALGFEGWEQALDIDPLMLYTRVRGSKLGFTQQVILTSPLMKPRQISRAFKVCERYFELKKEVQNYYDTQP